MILYLFISHNAVVVNDYHRISTMMQSLNYDHYLIVYGGEKHIENNYVVHINCDDSYAGLPSKTNKTMKYLSLNEKIDYVFKTDRTCIVKKIFDKTVIKDFDYCGRRIRFQNPNYHKYKCEKTSPWYNKSFNGSEIIYCAGPGYILSKKAMKIIAKDENYTNHIYEDYYVGETLKKHNILGVDIPIKEYFYDPEHGGLFR